MIEDAYCRLQYDTSKWFLSANASFYNIACNYVRMLMTPSPEIDKLIKLFTGEISVELHDRHCASIDRLCNASGDGFAIQDLPKIQQIMELTLGLLESGIGSFLEPACKLLRYIGGVWCLC